MRSQHQHLGFKHCFVTQRQVNRHLVTVKVGIKRCTCQWVQLDSFTLDHLGLESLDTQTVKCRSTVQQYRVTFHYVFKDIPNHRLLTVYNFLSRLHSLYDTALNQFTNNERFVQLGSHQLRNTTLVHSQFRTNNNYRTG